MHLTGAWCALHMPVCVVHVCHTSFLLWMWYVQVCLQAEGHQHSIPVTLVSLECLWGTLKLCHTHLTHCVPQMCVADLWAVMQCHHLLHTWHIRAAQSVEAKDTLYFQVCHHHKIVHLEKTSGTHLINI